MRNPISISKLLLFVSNLLDSKYRESGPESHLPDLVTLSRGKTRVSLKVQGWFVNEVVGDPVPVVHTPISIQLREDPRSAHTSLFSHVTV